MKMIIGGAHQGQFEWAQNVYNITWIDGAECEFEEIRTCQGIQNFQLYIRRLLRAEWKGGIPKSDKQKARQQEIHEISTETLAQVIKIENPDLHIVSDEIGYGLVPVDAFDRAYRETTGRICTELAAASEEVVRVVMGIGMQIK